MGTVPLPTNPTVDIVDQIIQGLIYDAGVQLVIAWAVESVPFLGLPIIKQLFSWAVGKAGQFLSTKMQNVIALSVIGFKTDAERAAYEDSINALMIATQKGTPNDIDKATALYRQNLGALIHWDGA